MGRCGWILAVLLAGVTAGVGCGKKNFRSAASHPVLGKPAPAFTLESVGGESVSLAAHQGKEVVVLDFWASWCGPCVESLPLISQVAADYQGRPVAFYAINVRESRREMQAFLARLPLQMPVLLDVEGQVADRYDVEGIPMTVVIDKNGVVQAIHRGFSPNLPGVLREEIDQLVSGVNILK